jgi:hypothetical protein
LKNGNGFCQEIILTDAYSGVNAATAALQLAAAAARSNVAVPTLTAVPAPAQPIALAPKRPPYRLLPPLWQLLMTMHDHQRHRR